MSHSSEAGKISCDVCRKEVPLSEAVVPEAKDYVAHFCGLDCYEQWKKQGVPAGSQCKKPEK